MRESGRGGQRLRTWLAEGAIALGLAGVVMVWPLARTMSVDGAASTGAAQHRVWQMLAAVRQAEAAYAGVNGYYDALECLLQTPCIPGIPSPPRYLSVDVFRSAQDGSYRYTFVAGPRARVRPGDPVSPTATSSYAIVARPTAADGRVGRRHAYCADSSGDVFLVAADAARIAEDGRCLDRSRLVRHAGDGEP